MPPEDEPPLGAMQSDYEPLTAEEFKKLVAEAQDKGEPTTPLVKRLVLTTIDDVVERLEEEGRWDDGD